MGTTTISVDESTLERFKRLKSELDDQQTAPDHTANSFLSALLDTWEAAENGYYDDIDPQTDIESRINDALTDAAPSLTYDDAKNAAAAAIREEFPDEVLRG